MSSELGKKENRFAISYFDGVNSSVSSSLSKRTELSHGENARSPKIGTLEKREGTTVKGTNLIGGVFTAQENHGITKFTTTDSSQQGLFRLTSSYTLESPSTSPSNSPSASLSTSTSPSVSTSPSGSDSPSASASTSPSQSTSPSNSPSSSLSSSPSSSLSGSPSLSLSNSPSNSPSSSSSSSPSTSTSTSPSPSISSSPAYQSSSTSPSVSTSPSGSISVSPSLSSSTSPSISTSISKSPSTSPSAGENVVDIYSLSTDEKWVKLTDPDAQNIVGGQFDYAVADQNLILVNKNDLNRQLSSDGQTVITSSDAGSLYNSPRAAKVCYYKNRIHLANFVSTGVNYPTSIVRSSYPMGIIALVSGDYVTGTTTLEVTDAKYFYSTTGMNTYDIYRGDTKIETITVTSVKETSLTISSTTNDFLSSDEIWIAGTYEGAKQYRWINNATSTGVDVKQYDTFRLSGGDDSGITLFDTIGDTMIMGNKTTLASWNDYTLTSMDLGIGCSSPVGSVKLLGTLFFVDYSGIYGTTGGMPTLLSKKVSRYIKGATKSGLENAAAGVKGMSIFFTIGDSTLYKDDGSVEKVLHDVCLEYDVSQQNWFVHYNVPIAEFENFMSTDGVEHLIGLHSGSTKSAVCFLEGETDLGDTIFMRVDTSTVQLASNFEAFSSPVAIITEITRGTQVKCYISPDESDFYAIEGEVTKGVSNLKITSRDKGKVQPINCRKIKVSYRDSSKQRPRITQMAIIYHLTPMDEVKE